MTEGEAIAGPTRLECTEDGSSKFWEGQAQGLTFTARWGKIGTDGQTKAKDFATAAKAQAEHDKLVKEKLSKGYVRVGSVAAPAPAAKPKPPAPPPAQPAEIAVTDLGADALGFVPAGDGYALRLHDGDLECRNPKGKVLSAVPPKLKQSEVGEQLLAVRDLLAQHDLECRAAVDHWMLASLPVPAALLAAVWPDPGWRHPLENAVMAPIVGGRVALESAGLFRGVDPQKGLGLVTLDGDTTWVSVDEVLVPHPILLHDLDDWRQLAAELSLVQGLSQLFRETFGRPNDLAPDAASIDTWSGGAFEQLNFAMSKAKTLGYRVRGGYVVCRLFEGGRPVEARYWIGAEAPDAETETGELLWVDAAEKPIPVAQLGPVALSEGIRMARGIYAARKLAPEAQP